MRRREFIALIGAGVPWSLATRNTALHMRDQAQHASTGTQPFLSSYLRIFFPNSPLPRKRTGLT